MTNCPVCGGSVEVIGKTTHSYRNLDREEITRLKSELSDLKTLLIQEGVDKIIENLEKAEKHIAKLEEIRDWYHVVEVQLNCPKSGQRARSYTKKWEDLK